MGSPLPPDLANLTLEGTLKQAKAQSGLTLILLELALRVKVSARTTPLSLALFPSKPVPKAAQG